MSIWKAHFVGAASWRDPGCSPFPHYVWPLPGWELVERLKPEGDDMETKKPGDDCCFRRLAGMELVFEPGCGGLKTGKKHPCPDCSFCQSCAPTRCLTCRSEGNGESGVLAKKLSVREQILLYEKVNANVAERE
jgi:hypothetical protein